MLAAKQIPLAIFFIYFCLLDTIKVIKSITVGAQGPLLMTRLIVSKHDYNIIISYRVYGLFPLSIIFLYNLYYP